MLVRAVEALCDQTFQALLTRGFKEFAFVVGEVLGIADLVRRFEDRLEDLLAVAKGCAPEVVAIKIQNVEEHQRHGLALGHVRYGRGVRVHDAGLNERESRDALRIQDRDFSIENDFVAVNVMRECAEFGILALAPIAIAGEDFEVAIADVTERADTVPFHF